MLKISLFGDVPFTDTVVRVGETESPVRSGLTLSHQPVNTCGS